MLILTHVSGKSTFFSRDELWFPSAINHFPLENGVGGLETLLLSLREDDLARWRPAMALASAGRTERSLGVSSGTAALAPTGTIPSENEPLRPRHLGRARGWRGKRC